MHFWPKILIFDIMTKRLYRPVGLKELVLILQAEAKAFPPRLTWQPIFYPVLNYDYAAQISREWNQGDEFSGYVGFVTAFDLDEEYLSKFEVQTVGADMHQELWVPAEELAEFNAEIQGFIQVIDAFYGESYQGIIPESEFFENLNAQEQLQKIQQHAESEQIAWQEFIQQDRVAIQCNFNYWKQLGGYDRLLDEILEVWNEVFVGQVLEFNF